VLQVQPVQWAQLALVVHKAQRATLVQRDRRARTDQQVQQVQPDHKAMRDQRVQLAPQV
jgi:hypothetical protein